jgi:hypothetical protein
MAEAGTHLSTLAEKRDVNVGSHTGFKVSRFQSFGPDRLLVTQALAQRRIRRYDSRATQESSHLAYTLEAGYETVQGIVAAGGFLFCNFFFSGMGPG